MNQTNKQTWDFLLALRDTIGSVYGSEDLAVLLYSLTKRERPQCILELGAGLGVCSFWMAHALRENGTGQLWSFDDGTHFGSCKDLHEGLKQLGTHLKLNTLFNDHLSYSDYFTEITSLLKLEKHLTLILETINFERNMIKPHWPFLEQPIDWIFSDIQHGPKDIILLLAEFLPFLASCSSIFIDSASTSLVSYLALERTIEQLNRGHIPCQFLAIKSEKQRSRLFELVHQRKFTLMHLIERKNRAQNSTAWIRIEPIDFIPHPQTSMRY